MVVQIVVSLWQSLIVIVIVMIVIMIIMIVVFNSCSGCRLLSHCDNRIHWPCLLFFSPIDGRIQVQLQITKVQMQMKMNTGSNKNKSESSRQWNKYSFHKSINAIDDFILSLPPARPAMRTVVRFIQKEERVWGELLSFIFLHLPGHFVSHFFAIQIFHGRAPPLGRLGCRRRARKSFQRWRRRLPGVYPCLCDVYLSNDVYLSYDLFPLRNIYWGVMHWSTWTNYLSMINLFYDLFANIFEIYGTITFIIAQASLGSGWDVANGNDWQEDSSLTITCSFWFYCM